MTTLIQEASKFKNIYEQSFDLSKLLDEIKNSTYKRLRALSSGSQDLVMKPNNERENNVLLGFFDCSYHPDMNLEALKYEKLIPNILLPEFNVSLVNAIKVVDGTKGLVDQEVVAVFPENFYNHKVLETDSIFYFADKFAKRHIKHTRKGIKLFEVESFFNPIMNLSQEELEQLATNWFHIHEHFHREGYLPLPTFLKEKNHRVTAGIEELRVDLETINYLIRKSQNKNDDYYKTMLFVLSERLIGYPFFRDMEKNFDAFSSFVFMQSFIKNNTLELSLGKLLFQIEKILIFINSTEKETLERFRTASERKSFLVLKYKEVLAKTTQAKELFIKNKRKLS